MTGVIRSPDIGSNWLRNGPKQKLPTKVLSCGKEKWLNYLKPIVSACSYIFIIDKFYFIIFREKHQAFETIAKGDWLADGQPTNALTRIWLANGWWFRTWFMKMVKFLDTWIFEDIIILVSSAFFNHDPYAAITQTGNNHTMTKKIGNTQSWVSRTARQKKGNTSLRDVPWVSVGYLFVHAIWCAQSYIPAAA